MARRALPKGRRLSASTAEAVSPVDGVTQPLGGCSTWAAADCEAAAELAVELEQHLFDTFYHAIALENSDAVLVTAFLGANAAGCRRQFRPVSVRT